MKRPWQTGSIILVVALVAIALAWWMQNKPAWKGKVEYNHVLLLTLDTTRRDHLPFYGYSRDTAPNLSQLAAEAVIFDSAVAAHTNTAPSHSSMLSGLYPLKHGVITNRHRLRPEVEILPQILGGLGYRSGAFVTGVALKMKTTGLGRGFTHYDDDFEGAERRDRETFRRVDSWIQNEAHRPEPVFIFCHYFAPHFPYDAPDGFAIKFLEPGENFRFNIRRTLDRADPKSIPVAERDELIRRYDGEIAYADHYIGRLVEQLQKHGYWEQTLLIFLADHGETLAERSWFFDHGGRVYDEQIRVPLFVRFPKGKFGNQRIDAPVHQVDILPTVLEYLGQAVPQNIQGQSLMPIIRGEAKADYRRPLYSHGRTEPIRSREVGGDLVAKKLITSLRLPEIKLIHYLTTTGFTNQLFELKTDPHEDNNLVSTNPQMETAMESTVEKWLEDIRGEKIGPAPTLSPEMEEALRSMGYMR